MLAALQAVPAPGYTNTGMTVDPVAAQDPAYLAFMRGAGYDEAAALADVARQTSELQRQEARKEPEWADMTRIGQSQIASQFGNNGLFRSGARMQGQVDQRNDVARQRLDYRSGITDQISDAQANAYRTIADLRRQAVDQALTGRSNAAIARAQGGQS